MSRILTAIFAIVCALTLAPAVADAAAAPGAGPVKILIIGDSLTRGRHGLYTWRYRLDKEFRRQGVAFDFVGSLSEPHPDPGYPPAHYLDPNFDQSHFAKAGWWLRDAVGGPLRNEVAAQDPDVVVFQLGGCDVVYGDSPEAVANRLRVALAEIQSAKPTVRIIIPEVLTRVRPDPEVNRRTMAYNAKLPGVAAEFSTAEAPVTVAGTMAGWSANSTYTFEGAHLSPTGEAFYARRLAERMQADGILPGAPEVIDGVIPWPRTERLLLRGAPGRIFASWSRHAVSFGRVSWRQAGTTAWRTSGLHGGGSVPIPVTGGRSYDVALQISWYGLTGPWGPPSRVAVPRSVRPAAPARVKVTRAGVRWSAASGASSYEVRFRKTSQRHWVLRRTRSTGFASRRLAVVKVRSVGPGGVSQWRRGVR